MRQQYVLHTRSKFAALSTHMRKFYLIYPVPTCEKDNKNKQPNVNRQVMSLLCSYHHNHNRIFDLHAGAGASSTSVGSLLGNRLAAGIVDLTPDLQVLLS